MTIKNITKKEQKAKDALKKFSDNHPLRKEQKRIRALESVCEAAIMWVNGGYCDSDLEEIILENENIINEK